MNSIRYIVIATLLATTVCAVSVQATDTDQLYSGNETENVTSGLGVNFTVQFDKDRNLATVAARNPTELEHEASFEVRVDGYQHQVHTLNLSTNETWRRTWNVSNSIDVMRDNHSVKFHTYNGSAQFNFIREYNPSNSSRVLSPRITDVEITEGEVFNQNTTVVKVTVENPARQIYGTNLMVNTRETTYSRRGGATAAPQGNNTVLVPIEEDPDTLVAGEVRLYDENLSEVDEGFDQREFVGRVDGDTEVYNRTYEAIEPRWSRNRTYHYENESVEQRIEANEEHTPLDWAIVITGGLLILWLFVRWVRR